MHTGLFIGITKNVKTDGFCIIQRVGDLKISHKVRHNGLNFDDEVPLGSGWQNVQNVFDNGIL